MGCSLLIAEVSKSSNNMIIMPSFNIKDSQGQTVLGLALWNGLHDLASKILRAGANMNERDAEGLTLLHQAVDKQDTTSALFLIEHDADTEAKYGGRLHALKHSDYYYYSDYYSDYCYYFDYYSDYYY